MTIEAIAFAWVLFTTYYFFGVWTLAVSQPQVTESDKPFRMFLTTTLVTTLAYVGVTTLPLFGAKFLVTTIL